MCTAQYKVTQKKGKEQGTPHTRLDNADEVQHICSLYVRTTDYIKYNDREFLPLLQVRSAQ
jgi:hypothetical protein